MEKLNVKNLKMIFLRRNLFDSFNLMVKFTYF